MHGGGLINFTHNRKWHIHRMSNP